MISVPEIKIPAEILSGLEEMSSSTRMNQGALKTIELTERWNKMDKINVLVKYTDRTAQAISESDCDGDMDYG